MKRAARTPERKPLSFSTTMRNPERIAGFLTCLKEFEGWILNSDVIRLIIKSVLNKGLYSTMYQNQNKPLLNQVREKEATYSDKELEEIILNSPQDHKEAGFEKGWDSRFDTWYKLPMEFGFIYYEMGKPIQISATGHMLIDAYQAVPINEEKIQNVFLNALIKYPTNNPFRKNLNSNIPLILLLNVLKKLKSDPEENGAGVFRQELPLFICWQDDNAQSLYEYIKEFRKEHKFSYSDEIIYERCLVLLDGENKRNRFKMSQICGESVDEYIRKMRSTGVISLRGNGRFLDLNMLEIERINYIIAHYSVQPKHTEKTEYYQYMGTVDSKILQIRQNVEIDLSDIRKATLYKYAKEYNEEKVFDELKKVCNKIESRDPILKFINAPTRLEFLTSIALVQQFKNLDVNPNYNVDDEGLPTFTAAGGMADIICIDPQTDGLFEVTLMRSRQDQVNNEIIPIRRHLLEYKQNKRENVFSVFVAPIIHEDTKEIALWYKHKDKIDIITYDIPNFIQAIKNKSKLIQLNS